jgi:hypothetical protein
MQNKKCRKTFAPLGTSVVLHCTSNFFEVDEVSLFSPWYAETSLCAEMRHVNAPEMVFSSTLVKRKSCKH